MYELERFIAENKPSGRTSKLDAYKEEIFILKDKGYSEKDILKFLAECRGVEVSQPALNRFIKSKMSTEDSNG